MCGIAGQINFDNSLVDRNSLIAMRDLLKHRGPDGEGLFLEGNIGFAHTRLKILDLSELGSQPMQNEDGSLVVVYNGEIYNFIEIREELAAKGHKFKSKCDTEVILHAYEEYNENCLEKFNGEFSFCLLDKKKQVLFCARDRLGIKPFYYHLSPKSFIFASEAKALMRNKYISRELDENARRNYLTFGYLPGEITMVKDIKKLLPGHYLLIKLSGEHLDKSYWDVDFIQQENHTEKEWIEIIKDQFANAIKLRLRSDVPLGLFLSGGLDSSTVLAFMRNQVKGKIKTYSVGFSYLGKYNELAYAKDVAKKYETDHESYVISAKEFSEGFKKFAWILDEPIVETPAIALGYLAQKAKSSITVALCGEGADELFAGYPQLITPQERRIQVLHPYLKTSLLKGVDVLSRYMWSERIRNLRRALFFSLLSRKDRFFNARIRDQSIRFYCRCLTESANFYDFSRNYHIDENCTWLGGALKADLKTYLPDRLLLKADRVTMAYGVELRVPFLDHHFVELAAKIPDTMKVNEFDDKLSKKYILKKMMLEYLPPEIVLRQKIGFAAPVSHFLRYELKDYFAGILFSTKSCQRDYFDIKKVKKIFDLHVSGKEDHSDLIWSLLVLEQWNRSFIDNEL